MRLPSKLDSNVNNFKRLLLLHKNSRRNLRTMAKNNYIERSSISGIMQITLII
jgi:hypothetical protein